MKQGYLTTFDLPALHRSTLGFDRLFDEINETFMNSVKNTYPPYNIIKKDETHTVLEVAVAGFKENELQVEIKDGMLVITGQRVEEEKSEDVNYLHRGISGRSFMRSFKLADIMEVRGASVKDGILTIEVEEIIPESQKPKKIQIEYKK